METTEVFIAEVLLGTLVWTPEARGNDVILWEVRMMNKSGSGDSSGESDISDIRGIRPRIEGAAQGSIVSLWDDHNNIRDIARAKGLSIKQVNKAIKLREKRRVEKEFKS